MPPAPPLDFRHSPGSFRRLSHAVFAFIRGAGGYRCSYCFAPHRRRCGGESHISIHNPAERAMRRQ